jgi:cyclic pyranopterin phosphate synthase
MPENESRRIALRISVTDRCESRCIHCTPAEGVERLDIAQVLGGEDILRFVRLIKAHYRLTKVHLTGGEPLDRPDIVRLVGLLAGEGIEDLAMTTSGQSLAELATDLKRAGLQRINVSLISLEPRRFSQLTGGGQLGRTLKGIDAALDAGLAPIKCNTPVLRGMNDQEVAALARWGIERGVQVRFIELMPIGPAAKRHRDWFVSSAESLALLREHFAVEPLPPVPESSCRTFQISDGGRTGTVGFISSCTKPFCAGCRRLRLTAGGELVGCLARNSRTSAGALLQADGPLDEGEVLARVRAVMQQKRTTHGFVDNHLMVRTGG